MKRLSCMLLAGVVAGCAAGMTSSVGTISDGDAQMLGPAVAEFVALRVRPGSSPITVDWPQGDTTLAPAVQKALTAAGYTVAPDAPHRLDYQAGALDDGVLLRLSLDGGDAARFYQRSPVDGLHASGPFSVRSAS